MVGSPTRPVMPNLIMLWKMGPLRGEGRAGARLWLREATRRARGGIGPGSKPGRGGWGYPGPVAGEGAAGRPAGGYFLAKKVSALESFSGPVQGQLNRIIVLMQVPGFVGRHIDCWCTSWRQSASAA